MNQKLYPPTPTLLIDSVLTLANTESLFKKMATLWFYEPYSAEAVIRFGSLELKVKCYQENVYLAHFDTKESLIDRIRDIECQFMTPLMSCKERVVRSTGWTWQKTLRRFTCHVVAVGVDSLKKPTTYLHHING